MENKEAPPPYGGQQQQQGYPQPQGPPQGHYPQPYPQPYPAGGQQYHPQQQQQYAGQPNPGYQPQHYAPPTTVIQVGSPGMAHTHTTTVIVERNINHVLHCCISLFFPPWIFVWIFLCLTN